MDSHKLTELSTKICMIADSIYIKIIDTHNPSDQIKYPEYCEQDTDLRYVYSIGVFYGGKYLNISTLLDEREMDKNLETRVLVPMYLRLLEKLEQYQSDGVLCVGDKALLGKAIEIEITDITYSFKDAPVVQYKEKGVEGIKTLSSDDYLKAVKVK